MSRLTRRSFVKRTGAVSLGSALGLGLLPSVTRKLYAVDTSTFMGITPTAAEGVSPSAAGLNYPPGAPVGEMLLTIGINASVAVGVCALSITVTISRTATYTQLQNGVDYKGTAKINSYYIWICEDGVVKLSKMHTDFAEKDVAVSGGGGQIGTLRSETDGPPKYKARMFWQALGDYGPWSTAEGKMGVARCALA